MDESSRLTKTKEQWAKARRGGEEREVFYEGDARLPGRRADRVQVRRHRACEVERPLHDRGAKKEYRSGF